MQVVTKTPPAIKTDYLPWKPTYLIPVGDIQLGAQGVDTQTLREDIQRGLDLLKQGNEVFYIGMGDFVDMPSPSGRRKIRAADFYDSVVEALEEDAREQINKFLNLVKGTKGRWLGVLQGHHFYEFGDGRTSDTIIADALDAPFLGDSAFVKMTWLRTKKTGSYSSIVIYATHGVGSGQTQSAPLNKLEKLAGAVQADLYLINHYARRGAIPIDQVYLSTRGRIHSRTVYLVATGGYMKAYDQSAKRAGRAQGSYVEKAMMKPVTLGGVLISLTPQRNYAGGSESAAIKIGVEV